MHARQSLSNKGGGYLKGMHYQKCSNPTSNCLTYHQCGEHKFRIPILNELMQMKISGGVPRFPQTSQSFQSLVLQNSLQLKNLLSQHITLFGTKSHGLSMKIQMRLFIINASTIKVRKHIRKCATYCYWGENLYPLHHYLESDNSSKHNILEALGDLMFKLLPEQSTLKIQCIKLNFSKVFIQWLSPFMQVKLQIFY